MVFVCHYGGVVGYFDVVVNTPRKLHSAGPTNRDYPKSIPNSCKPPEPSWVLSRVVVSHHVDDADDGGRFSVVS